MRIEPTLGRIVWFFPPVDDGRHEDGQPFASMIAGVNDDGTINLMVAARDGSPSGVQNVALLQDGDDIDQDKAHAVWMPFQKSQAAKTDAAVAAVAAAAPALEPVHAAIAELTAKTETALAAPAAALESAHAKISEVEAATQTKFEDLGEWLKKMFTDFEQKLETVKNAPPTANPGGAAEPQA